VLLLPSISLTLKVFFLRVVSAMKKKFEKEAMENEA
jgi:hypothetical protein